MTRILAYPDDNYQVDKPPLDALWCECGLHARRTGCPKCPICTPDRYTAGWRTFQESVARIKREEAA